MYKAYPDLREELISGKISCEEITAGYLENIEKGKHLNAFLSVFRQEALAQAKLIDQKLRNGTAGKLAGMVVSVKDVLSVKDKPLTCASKILDNFKALYTATSVQRLIDEDAIIIGKTNCDEFAMGSSNENSAFGPVFNPCDETRVPGGSSGGSAVSVRAGMCMTSLGTDTGGSVRQPAAFCGIIGLKPTYGRISRYGLTAFASSFDTVGIFSTNITDSALMLEVMSGYDSNDSTSSRTEPFRFEDLKTVNTHNLVIGIPDEFINSEALQPEIQNKLKFIKDRLVNAGFTVKSVSLPNSRYSIQTYYILTTAEASSNLARYDGVRYGYRSPKYDSLEEMYTNSRTEGFGSEVKRRILLGTFVLSAGYYDAYYRKAQKARRLIKNDYTRAFSEVDVIIGPSTPTTAFKIGEKSEDPLQMYLNDIYTTSANITGNPAISIPAGKDNGGLPIGIQITGKDFDEKTIMAFADYLISDILNQA